MGYIAIKKEVDARLVSWLDTYMPSTTYCRPCDAHHDQFGIAACNKGLHTPRPQDPRETDILIYVALGVPAAFFSVVAALVAVL